MLQRSRLRRLPVLALAAAAAACGGSTHATKPLPHPSGTPAPAGQQRPGAASGDRPFAADSFWNSPLAANAPLAKDSTAIAADLDRQVATHSVWMNTTQYSVPVFTVPHDQKTVRVKLDVPYSALQSQFDAVPIPADAEPARGSDAHMVIEQPSTDTMWEFFKARKAADGWHARWGGRLSHVDRSPGVFGGKLGATATGLPLAGGLIHPDELKAGHIDHVLALGIPNQRTGAFVAPAQRTDAGAGTGKVVPAGTRFRLPADLDLTQFHLSPGALAIAKAIQRYGMVVRDTAGTVVFYAQDPNSLGQNPYPAIFGTRSYDKALKAIPWDKLQVVAPASSRPSG